MAFKPKRKADLSQLFKHRPPTAGILYFKKEKCTSNYNHFRFIHRQHPSIHFIMHPTAKATMAPTARSK